MFANRISFSRWAYLFILILVAGLRIGRAQDGSIEDIKYNDDYESIQKIAAVTQPLKRADQLVTLISDRRIWMKSCKGMPWGFLFETWKL